MPLLILIALLAVPYFEFLVFLEVGNAIGGFQALLLTILTAVLGVYLIREQGLVVMNRMHETLQRGDSPVEDIIHGFFLLIAGLFFLLPGFITDTVAVLLAIGPFRAVLGKTIIKNVQTNFYKHHAHPPHKENHQEGIVIDGEFEEDQSPKNNNSKNIDHKE